jgi:hypothetical protein
MRDIHYGPSPIDTEDQSYFNVFFTDKPPVRPTLELQMGTLGISEIIPPLVIPQNVLKMFTTTTIVPEDISLLTVNPHMHLLGKSFEAFAVTPDSRTIPLIKIPKWNFRWRVFLTFPKMVKIPKSLEFRLSAFMTTRRTTRTIHFHRRERSSEPTEACGSQTKCFN